MNSLLWREPILADREPNASRPRADLGSAPSTSMAQIMLSSSISIESSFAVEASWQMARITARCFDPSCLDELAEVMIGNQRLVRQNQACRHATSANYLTRSIYPCRVISPSIKLYCTSSQHSRGRTPHHFHQSASSSVAKGH